MPRPSDHIASKKAPFVTVADDAASVRIAPRMGPMQGVQPTAKAAPTPKERPYRRKEVIGFVSWYQRRARVEHGVLTGAVRSDRYADASPANRKKDEIGAKEEDGEDEREFDRVGMCDRVPEA
jgi:hypothetical protein